jgi:TolB-like protein/class 3 adenylate cyclase/Flp pilus assembly protein TadD
MPSEQPSEVKFEIGHVLFMDIVGYSKLLITEQSKQLQTLKQIVRGTDQFRLAQAEGKLLSLPTGDGAAIVFRNNPEAPVLCAVDISKELRKHPTLRVRMGVHSGTVNEISDLNEQANIAGAGINIAQRVMDCGDAGHILLSKRVAEDLEQYPQWRSHLHDLGECEVKHGARVGVVNLYDEEIGNPASPERIRAAREKATALFSDEQKSWQASRKRRLVIALITLCVLIAMFWIFAGRTSRHSASLGPPSGVRSLAVMPLRNLSGDPTQDYFADGITDSLITDLSHIRSLRVISFQSVQQYKGEHRKSLPEIARELNVDAVVEGSVQKSGDTVMINAQLIRAPTDQHLWADRYTRNARDVLQAQNDIVLAIANEIKVQLTPEEKTRFATARPVDPEAQSHYFMGRSYFGMGTEAGLRQAISEYEQAIQKDPNFAAAYAGIASSYSALSSFYLPPREAMPKAEEAARKALGIDSNLAEAHSAIGYIDLFYHWNRAEGERELLKAIELSPSYSTAYLNYGILLLTQSRFNEASDQLHKALDLEPTSALISSSIEWALFLAGKYDDVIAQAQHTLTIEPKMSVSYSQMGLAYLYLGNTEKALAYLKTATEMEFNSPNVTSYAYALAVSGQKEEADGVLNGFLEKSKGKYVCAYEVASAYEGMHERAKALEWLERGYEEKCDCLVWGSTEPWMGQFRQDPRYKALLAKAGLIQ